MVIVSADIFGKGDGMNTGTKTEKKPRVDKFKVRKGKVDWYVFVGEKLPEGSAEEPISLSAFPEEYVESHTRQHF